MNRRHWTTTLPERSLTLLAFLRSALLVCLLAAPSAASRVEAAAGEPAVRPRDGAVVLEETDLVAGSGTALLVVARTYQGGRVTRGPFGPGWSSPFDVSLRRVGQDLVMTGGAGEVRTLERDPSSGYFWGLPGEFVLVDARGAERRYVSGERARFDGNGRLVEMAGRNSSVPPFRFEYGASGRLERITLSDGSTVGFAYDAAGRVTQVGSAGVTASYRYDPQGRLAEVTDAEGSLTRYRYDAKNRLVAVEDGAGYAITLEYDGAGRLHRRAWSDGRWERFTHDAGSATTRVEYPDGYWLSIQYARNGRLETTRDSLGHQEVAEYDANGALVRAVDATGTGTAYAYDSTGRLVRTETSSGLLVQREYLGGTDLPTRTRVAGQEWRHEYDAAGNVTVIVAPGGARTTFAYLPSGLARSVTSPAGHTTTFEYDQAGRVVRSTNPLGGVTRQSYDARGRLVAVEDPVGGTTRLEYAPAGQLARVVDPLGAQTRYEYDARGRLVALIDPLGRRTAYEYDAAGRLAKIAPAGAGAQTYRYDARGRVAGITDPLGRSAALTLDGLGRIQAVRGPAGTSTTFAYDAKGSWSLTDAAGGRGSYAYDPAQFLARVTDPVGAVAQRRFDPFGRLTASVDPLGRTTRFTYGPLSELTGVSDAAGETARYVYDAARRLAKVVHPNGGETVYTHDALGNVLTATDPTGQTRRYTYDPAGRLTSATSADGRTTRFAYDAAHRLIQRTLPGGGRVTYAYDAAGKLLRVDDQANPVGYEYDALGRLTRVQYPSLGKTVRREYDARGLRSKVIAPDGREITYQYDATARLVGIAGPDGRAIRFTYDAAGRPSGIRYPNGVSGRYAFDAAGRPTAIGYVDGAGRPVAGWTYTYDAAGNRTETRAASGVVTAYRYDANGQLVEEAPSDGPATRYAYTPGGDRQRREQDGRAVSYRHDAGHRLVEAGPAQLAYDRAGRLIRRQTPQGTTTYTYDDEGRLAEVARPEGAVRFGYAATGQRLWREEGGKRTFYVHDGLDLLGEIDAAGQMRALYLHGPGVDMPLAAGRADGWQYLHADVLGSIAAVTGDGGRVVAQARYGAFGEPHPGKGPALPVPFGFTGREWDPATGLSYHRARYYDPALGRFLGPDPAPPALDDLRSLNPYLYASNNPVRFTDPLGLASAADQLTQWLIEGGFWNPGGGPVNYNPRMLDAYGVTAKMSDQVTFGPDAAASYEAAISTAYHEWIHRMQNQRLVPLVNRLASDAAQAAQRATAIARIQQQGGMLHGAAGPLRKTLQAIPARTSGSTILELFRSNQLVRQGEEMLVKPISNNARNVIVRTLQQQGSLVGGEKVLMQSGVLAVEQEAYLMEAAFNARSGFIGEGFGAIRGYLEHGGSRTQAALMTAKLVASPVLKTLGAVLGPALTALNVYGVANQIRDNYAGFQAARELRGLEWQMWKNGLRLTDMQDEIVEQALRNWLAKHPEAIRPGMKIEDAIAQALGNLHDNRPPFENVVATAGNLSAERDKLRTEIAEAKNDVARASENLAKLQALRAAAAKTLQTWEQHQRDRTKILQDFARMPATAQQQRQADVKRNVAELETVKRELKTASERLSQIDDRIGLAKADVRSAEYHQKLKEDELKKAEERLAQRQRAGARP